MHSKSNDARFVLWIRKDEDSSCFHVSQETEKHVCVILRICLDACLKIKMLLGFWKYVFSSSVMIATFFYLCIKFTWRGRQGYLLCRGFLLDSKPVFLRLKKLIWVTLIFWRQYQTLNFWSSCRMVMSISSFN